MTNSIQQKIKAKYRKGFTLIETLVAILILVMAITGPLTIAEQGLQSALIAKDQVVAYYLAQDAVEYVRFVRDSNNLACSAAGTCGSADWLSGLDGGNGCVSSDGSASCYFDSMGQYPATPTACTGGCPALDYDSSGGSYQYSNGSASIFTRTVSITSPTGGYASGSSEALLTVKVSWTSAGSATHTVTLNEDLFRWQ